MSANQLGVARPSKALPGLARPGSAFAWEPMAHLFLPEGVSGIVSRTAGFRGLARLVAARHGQAGLEHRNGADGPFFKEHGR